ncbi:phosphodiester glycosidase family protein [Brachybacterium sp. DNPG3]
MPPTITDPQPSGPPGPPPTAPPSAPDPERSRRLLPRRALLGGGLVVLVGAGGSAGWAYDRFLREKVEVADVTAAEEAAGTAQTAQVSSTDGAFTEDGYTSSTTTITVTTDSSGSGDDTLTWYVADVQVSDAALIRSALADDSFGENITQLPSEMAEAHGAVLAINGDYYGFRDTGIQVRNGVALRDEPARDGFVIWSDGTAEVYDETTTSAQELVDAGAWQTLSFGPAVLVDGQIPDGIEDVEIDTNIGNHSIQGEQPRTAIGVLGDGHLVFLVVDGRDEGYSRGATLPEVGQILADLGCTTGYNLDGGGSSVMILDDEILNQPSNGGERATSDILYVAG